MLNFELNYELYHYNNPYPVNHEYSQGDPLPEFERKQEENKMEKEIMHIVHWILQFESGTVEYRRSGITRWDVGQHEMKLYFDSTSSMVSESFPFEGDLIKFWTELDLIPEQEIIEWWK
jgi:hypothetical protein